MSAFDGLKRAKTSEAGVYLGEGDFTLRVLRCTVNGRTAPVFFAECEVVANRTEKKNDKGEIIDPVGAKRSWAQKLQDKDVGFGALKAFIYACSGLDPRDPKQADEIAKFDQEIEKVADEAVGPAQALSGLLVNDLCFLKESKGKPGQFYHRHNFSPVK